MRLLSLALLGATLSTAPASADCLSDIKDILTRSLDSGPYAIEMIAGDETANIEIIPFVAMHSSVATPDRAMEMTVLDGKAWTKASGSWTAMHDDAAAQLTSAFSVAFFVAAPGGGAATVPDRITEPECLGSQNFEGRDYLTFRFDPEIGGTETRSTLYVDPATLLPAVVIGTSTFGGTTTDTRATYRYDPSVTVSAPM